MTRSADHPLSKNREAHPGLRGVKPLARTSEFPPGLPQFSILLPFSRLPMGSFRRFAVGRQSRSTRRPRLPTNSHRRTDDSPFETPRGPPGASWRASRRSIPREPSKGQPVPAGISRGEGRQGPVPALEIKVVGCSRGSVVGFRVPRGRYSDPVRVGQARTYGVGVPHPWHPASYRPAISPQRRGYAAGGVAEKGMIWSESGSNEPAHCSGAGAGSEAGTGMRGAETLA